LLAEQTADQLDRSPRRPAALVQKWIEFDNIDGSDQPGFVQQLHDQMRFAVSRAARHRRPNSRRDGRIEKIDVETDMQHAVAGAHMFDEPADQHPDTKLVDLAHFRDANAARAQQVLF
jgi:hypothetical protein